MKESVINQVLMIMAGKLSDEISRELREAIYIALSDYNLEKSCTEIIDLEQSYIKFLNVFLIRKKTEGRTERTIAQYELHLKRMLQHLNKPIDKITEEDLFIYLTTYKNTRNVSNLYLDNIRLVFSSFFGWLNNKGYISKNPTSGLDPIKKEKKIKKPFSDEDFEKMKVSCKCHRDIALIEFLYSTGVRASELIALNRSDIDFYNKSVVVYGKGCKERETYLTDSACYYLKIYLKSRTDEEEALFVSSRKPHSRLQVGGIERILKNLGKISDVERVHPHKFRRTMATNILKKGMPLEEVKELLGHTKLDTTMIYCTVNQENVKCSHKRLMSIWIYIKNLKSFNFFKSNGIFLHIFNTINSSLTSKTSNSLGTAVSLTSAQYSNYTVPADGIISASCDCTSVSGSQVAIQVNGVIMCSIRSLGYPVRRADSLRVNQGDNVKVTNYGTAGVVNSVTFRPTNQ